MKQAIYFIKRGYHFIKTGLLRGLSSQIKYSFPARKLTVIAITGTDGKTTSATLLYHVLKKANKKVALLSTVAAYIEDQEIDTGFHVTSPDPRNLQKFMKTMVDRGIQYLVLEVTSHGAYQFRDWGISPQITGLTNISHEHLDYHLTYQNYVYAKSLILRKAPVTFLNEDDQSFNLLKKLLKNTQTKVKTYSVHDRIYSQVIKTIRTRFPESYNQMNARLVYAITQKLGVSNNAYIKAITDFPGIPGRMQIIESQAPFQVVIDFAHTPNALKEALHALKKKLSIQKKKGKLIAVFGCAGLRDYQKRPMMGKIATEIADLAIFTAEDPRTEDVWSIIRQMKESIEKNHRKIISIPDRREAIEYAINTLASPGDIIGVFGKGHEKSMCYGTTEQPWSDFQVAQETLEENFA